MEVNIFTQIGFVVLVGLASKNAILIVEFAKQQQEAGVPRAGEATVEACRLRLRPILMTSFAFILGVVPLVVATAPAPRCARSLGLAVFSGMLGVTFFGIFLTPVFYYVIQPEVGGSGRSSPSALKIAAGIARPVSSASRVRAEAPRGGGQHLRPGAAGSRRYSARLAAGHAGSASRRPAPGRPGSGPGAISPWALRQRVFGGHEVLLQEGDAGEIGRAGRVLGQGDVDGLGGVGHAGGLGPGALLGPQELHQPVLRLLIGVEHGVLIGCHQLLERAS